MLDENELLFDKLYEKTKDCGRTQFIRLLMSKERENQQLKKQLEYLRSGEYLNQLKFERNLLEDIVQDKELSNEVYSIKEMMKANTKLCEKLELSESVIKEIREYIEKHLTDKGRFLMLNEWQVPELLQILDKGDK